MQSAAGTSPQPPLHLWAPELSGDIDIVIRKDGSWIHEGGLIKRASLVALFASILRREDDGEYYLVTPVEKWRLTVECLPLIVDDFDREESGAMRCRLNTGRSIEVDGDHPLFVPEMPCAGGIPAIQLDYGLAALFSRAAWYRLAEYCEERDGIAGISAGGQFLPLEPEQGA